MKLKYWFAPFLLCLSMLLLGSRPGSSQEVVPLEPQWLRDMYADGWQKVEEGVLQRDAGEGQFETLGYGAEGLKWVEESLQWRLQEFEAKYDASPNDKLLKVIELLREGIERLHGNWVGAASADSVGREELNTDCSLAYGLHSEPYVGPQEEPRGVMATANAYFYSDCYAGRTTAYAYAHASEGTVETTETQTDFKDENDGTQLESYAFASAIGSSDCESRASALVEVPELDIAYTIPEKINTSCPAGVTASIAGPTQAVTDFYGPSCADVTWTASASGGNPVYTYSWYIGGVLQGTGPSLTKNYCGVNTTASVTVVAQDTLGWTDDATYTTDVSHKGEITASINGPSSVSTNSATPCADVTWTASASSSGHTGFIYNWYIGTTLQGSGPTFTKRYCSTSQSVTVKVIARASDAHESAAVTKTTTITYTPTPPTASISGSATVQLATAGECKSISWTGNASGGAGGYTYSWYIGTSTTVQGTAKTLTKSFCGAQTVNVKVVVRDSAGLTDDATFTTTLVNPALAVTITGPELIVNPGSCLSVTLYANATGGTPGYTYSWYLNNGTTVVSTSSSYTKRVCSAGFTAKVTVRDAAAKTASDTHVVDVETYQ